MATEVVKIVDPGGTGDYTSLSAWESGEQRNLVSADEIAVAECQNTTGVADNSVTFSGWTTDSSHYVKVWTDPSDDYRHEGVWDTTKYYLEDTADYALVRVCNLHIHIHGLQLHALDSHGIEFWRQDVLPSSYGQVSHCVIKSSILTIGLFCNSPSHQIWNNIIYNFNIGISFSKKAYYNANNSKAYNNTIYNCNVGILLGMYYSYTAGCHCKNNIVQESSNYSFTSNGWAEACNNISNDATAPGANSKINTTVLFHDSLCIRWPELVNDYHICLGSEACDAGIDLSTIFSDDIDGDLRPINSIWDIGADECLSTLCPSFRKAISDPISVDVGNYVTQEKIVSKTIQFSSFTSNVNAVWAANNRLRSEAYPLAKLKLTLNRNHFRLQIGDCFKFSYAKYGMSNVIFRVMQIQEKNILSEKIIVDVLEDAFSCTNAPDVIAAPIEYTDDPPTYSLNPFTYTKMTEMYYHGTSDIKLLPLACRKNTYDLGFTVYISLDGGSTYITMEKVENICPYGTLVLAYPADTYTIDDDIGFTVDFVDDGEKINDISWSSLFSGSENIALLGDEVISFKNITHTGGSQYTISDIIRGRYGTQKVAHAASETFYHLSTNIKTVNSTAALVGASLKFKLVPYNINGNGVVASASAIDLTTEGDVKKPFIPINFMANGSSCVARYSTDIILTWSPRNKDVGAGIGLPGTVLAETDRLGLFEIEVWVSSVKVRTETAIDAATWTYTSTMNTTDNGSLVNAITFKLLNYKIEATATYSSDQVEVICKKT